MVKIVVGVKVEWLDVKIIGFLKVLFVWMDVYILGMGVDVVGLDWIVLDYLVLEI